jgi:type II secretory ATPase GspE/PulE/Tfp pilus assembly ATPase PilB-like protein
VARELSAAPIRKTAHGLEVAVSEPLGGPALAQLENFVGGPVVMLLAPADEVGRMIERSYPHVRIPSPLESQEPADGLARPESPGHIVLQAIVSRALRAGASDIHIDVRPIGARVEGHRLAGTVRRGQREVNRFDMTVDGRRLRVVVTAFMADN